MKRGEFVFKALRAAALVLAAGLALAPPPAAAQNGPTCTAAAPMQSAAAAAGQSIESGQITILSNNDLTLAAAPITGYEQSPATALAGGVDYGFIYLNAPSSGIPAGYYTLRATAPAGSIQVGEYGASVDLVGANGAVVTTLAGTVQTSSLQVPNPLPYPNTKVSFAMRILPTRTYWVDITFLCPNGSIITITLIITCTC
jgi:hypothetical protein